MSKPIVWTLAGSDSGGGAGIQADLQTLDDLGVFPCSVITAITAQNSQSVCAIENVSAQTVVNQIEALHADLPARVIKLGMLGEPQSVKAIGRYLQDYQGFVIADPVILTTNGDCLTDQETIDALCEFVFPFVDLLTPNRAEAERLLNRSLKTTMDVAQAAQDLLAFGPQSVLITGGDAEGEFSQDYWTNSREAFWLTAPRIHSIHTHGSGCTLSSAIAALIALDYDIKDALVIAKMYVSQGIRHAQQYGLGAGPVAHCAWPSDAKDLPWVNADPHIKINFANCGEAPLGLYPIVENSVWLERLLPLGVSTIQLRIKDKPEDFLHQEIKEAVQIARRYSARLFINDHWKLALQYGAYGVHLGQEDLENADFNALEQAGLRLGISTHSYFEVARAKAYHPSYIAFGPIYPTTSKPMAFGPQGLERLSYWRGLLNEPFVAIGGIDETRLLDVAATGVDGIAMISAICHAKDPEQVTQHLLSMIGNLRDEV